MMNTFLSFRWLVFAVLLIPVLKADLDSELRALATDEAAVTKGKTVYSQMCFACHGAKLEGAAGPDLRDATWLHGSKPTDIFRVITKGVSEKGMMPYELVYDEATRKNLTAFILSKQHGLREVSYEVYPPVEDPAKGLPRFGSGDPIKAGETENGQIDLSAVEVQEYVIAFKGTFLAPRDIRAYFNGTWQGGLGQLRVGTWEGEEPKARMGYWLNLEAGAHPLEFVFQRTSKEPRPLFLDVRVLGTGDLPLSLDSHQRVTVPERIYAAAERPKVVRTRLPGIPSESKAVGLPGGISFTLGRDASVYTVWDGLFLNTGPNVTVRGKKASLTGSPWFAHTDGVHLLRRGKRLPLRLVEYRFEGNEVTFMFVAERGAVNVRGKVVDGALVLTYETTGLEGLALHVPPGVCVEVGAGALDKATVLPVVDSRSFSVTLYKLNLSVTTEAP